MTKHYSKYYSWMVFGILAILGNSHFANAEEHLPSSISGPEVSLFERDHTFAGSIAQTPVFGVFDESVFGAKVEMRRHGQTLVLSLQAVEKKYSGDIVETQTGEDGSAIKTLTTHIEFKSVKPVGTTEGEIALQIDDQPVTVKISAKSFKQGHFQAPHFETTIQGKTVSFDFSGEACFGYSANIAMMILAPYVHLNK